MNSKLPKQPKEAQVFIIIKRAHRRTLLEGLWPYHLTLMRNLSYGNETRAERLITEKYDFLEKTSHILKVYSVTRKY